jgi:uncharacterized protein (DUF983 family)
MIGGLAKTGILRGLACRCPNCGEAPLFSRYITVRRPCPVCKIDNTQFASDDLPPYLTVAVVGHVVVPAYIWFDLRFTPQLWIEVLLWVPLTLALSLALLPRMKGASIGLAWASGTMRPEIGKAGDQAVAAHRPAAATARTPRP